MTTTLNMRDISNAVAEKFGMTKLRGAEVTRHIFEQIKAGLTAHKQVRLHGFGTLNTKRRAARLGRNPATGGSVKVPATVTVKLTPSPALKALLD